MCRLNIIKNEDSEEKKQVKGTTLEKKKKEALGEKYAENRSPCAVP